MSVFYIALAAGATLLWVVIATIYEHRIEKARNEAEWYASAVIRLAVEIQNACPRDQFVKRWVLEAKESATEYIHGLH
jgi:hypothetical protein